MSNDTTKKTRVLTVDDLASLIEAAVAKIGRPHTQARPPRPDIDDLVQRQNTAILHHELAQEKREKVSDLAKRRAPVEQQIAALGGDSALTPLQLARLHSRPFEAPYQDAIQDRPHAKGTLEQDILGASPTTRMMERFADISQKLRGSDVGSNERGEVVIGGSPIQGSSLVTALRFLVKGSRGFKGLQPPGAQEIGTILRDNHIASSKFPESVRPLLGGSRGRKTARFRLSPKKSVVLRPGSLNFTPARGAKPRQESVDEGDDDLSNLATTMGEQWSLHDSDGTSDDDVEQSGRGFGYLNAACDHAIQGNHDEAWDALNEARQLRAPRDQIKKVETYIAPLRDYDLNR